MNDTADAVAGRWTTLAVYRTFFDRALAEVRAAAGDDAVWSGLKKAREEISQATEKAEHDYRREGAVIVRRLAQAAVLEVGRYFTEDDDGRIVPSPDQDSVGRAVSDCIMATLGLDDEERARVVEVLRDMA
jgi:hypothetical protein